jgi:hypothetical protein
MKIFIIKFTIAFICIAVFMFICIWIGILIFEMVQYYKNHIKK